MNYEENTLLDDMFSEHRTELCEFKSNWNGKISKNELIDQQTETDGEPEKNDKSISTIDYQEIGIQTISTNDAIRSMETIIDDRKLADWLKGIYPLIEKELNDGCTNVFEIFDDDFNTNDINIYGTQTLIIGNNDKETITMDNLIQGTACWLSITTDNAPILVIAGSSIHDSWCQHTNPRIYIFQPIRNKELNTIIYKELTSIQVKSCIRVLSTNPFNKDYFAGGTVSGDLYIWHYESGTTTATGNRHESVIVEKHSEISQYGSCSSIAWLNVHEKISQRLIINDDFVILTCHIDGIIILWRIGNGIIKDKIFKIKISENDLMPSIIIGCNNNNEFKTGMESEFFVGTEEGKILLCTITQNLPYSDGNKTHIYDPIVSELESHKFAVTTMQIVKSTWKQQQHNNKELLILISCDLSGQILFHIINETTTTNEWITEPFRTIKLPLPFKNHIVCTKDLSNVIATSENGNLEIFKINQSSSKKIIQGQLHGTIGNVIAISDNECWLVTGCYKGHFQLYCIEKNV